MKEVSRKRLDKAERAIGAARTLLASDDAEFAAGRAYYAMLYTAEALLAERELSFSKHGAVHAAFGREFAKTALLDPRFHRWMLDAFDKRITADYGVDAEVEAAEVEEMVRRADAFLTAARQHLATSA